MYNLLKIWKPEIFQGANKNKTYFEGWYHKLISDDGKYKWAIIPGISITQSEKFTFIQYINGCNGDSGLIKYNFTDFKFSKNKYEVWIADNYFSRDVIKLNLNNSDFKLKGEIKYKNSIKLKTSLLYPGIMGWYSFVPFMQCYHGLISLNHTLDGNLYFKKNKQDFSGGKGYIEKDYGRSFPNAYIWLQCNNFTDPDISLMISIADIPWLFSSFTGLIGVLWYKGRIHTFATYNNSKINNLNIKDELINIAISNKELSLNINIQKQGGSFLAAPILGEMTGRISESINSTVDMKIIDNKYKINLLQTNGRYAGFEIAGDINKILKNIK